MYKVLAIILTVKIALISAGHHQHHHKVPARIGLIQIGNFDSCEGKDAGNYTLVRTFTREADCNPHTSQDSGANQLVQCGGNSAASGDQQRAVNTLVVLARSVNDAGVNFQRETLWLIQTGPLQGKYLYEKVIYLQLAYLKKCSTVLGYSYTTSVSATLLINDTLDLNVFLSPTGGFEVFRKGCATICKGHYFNF